MNNTSKPINIRLTLDLYNAIKKLAEQEDRSMSQVAKRLIASGLAPKAK